MLKHCFPIIEKIFCFFVFIFENRRVITYLIINGFHKGMAFFFDGLSRFFKFIRKKISYRPYWWQFLFSQSNFLLAVRPRPWQLFSKKSKNSLHFSPPGYGVPPGYGNLLSENQYIPTKEYSLYLFSGKLRLWDIAFSIPLAFIIFLPLIPKNHDFNNYIIMIIVYWFLSFIIYYFLFYKCMPSSLDGVWKKWPIPAYELFLSVPHKVSINYCDAYTLTKDKKNKISCYKTKTHLFWRPDIQRPMYRQATEHSADMESLQEVILNLAVFELLFHKKKRNRPKEVEKEKKKYNRLNRSQDRVMKIIKEKNWYLFLFAPIWINFVLISLSIFFFSAMTTVILDPAELEWRIISNFPYNFLFAVFIWFALTAFYIYKILNSLHALNKKIRKGYFNTHLDLIPQQILDELSYIPSHDDIEVAMLHLRTVLGWISSVALFGLLGVLEVLSQAYGDHLVYFKFFW